MTASIFKKIRDGFSKIFNNAGTISHKRGTRTTDLGGYLSANRNLKDVQDTFTSGSSLTDADFDKVAQKLVDEGKGLRKRNGDFVVFKRPRRVTP